METIKVLVVDDEMGMRFGVQRALKDYVMHMPDISAEVNFDIDMAEDGRQALSKLNSESYDLLLLDHKLPDMTGLDILGNLSGSHDGMLTIMITAYASLETAVTAIKRGAYDFLAKPFTPVDLRNTVSKGARTIILAKQAKKLAQEKRQVRFEFIRVLAHELKAPLNAIEGYLNIVNEKSAGDDPAVYDNMVERSLVRIVQMRKMIADLLDITRIESGQMKREFEQINLMDIVQHSIENSLPSAKEREISISFATKSPVIMKGVRTEIEMLMNNLISNAVKYNRDGGKVEVKVDETGDTLQIEVSDTGIGMSKDELAKLFNEFVRIRNQKTKNILGSGLGLSIVKKIISLYDGAIKVESEPDVGSRFIVTLKKEVPSEYNPEKKTSQ